MKTISLILLLALTTACFCTKDYATEICEFFEDINDAVRNFNALGAAIAWEVSINPNAPKYVSHSDDYYQKYFAWKADACADLAMLQDLHWLNETHRRLSVLLCNRPKYSDQETKALNQLFETLQSNYSDLIVCLPADAVNPAGEPAGRNRSSSETSVCLKGERELDNLMRTIKDEEVAKYLWTEWRNRVGPNIRTTYKHMTFIQNLAAQRSGYLDIGAVWRAHLEIPDLQNLCFQLYDEILPLYRLLHGVVRFYLHKIYGEIVPERGPIPAHLLGSLSSQDWESLTSVMLERDVSLSAGTKNWTLRYMARTSEDYHRSLGLPAMTDTFWQESVFTAPNEHTQCLGSAMDMFEPHDFRIIYCPKEAYRTMDDFYLINHEMGNIQYYMAYENQTALFRQANAVLQESIGDAMMLGIITPQNLNRLNLINDSLLFTSGANSKDNTDFKDYSGDEDEEDYCQSKIKGEKKIGKPYIPKFDKAELSIDIILLLHQALIDLPQIPYTFVLDEFRWRYFEMDMRKPNHEFWWLARELQGIVPPEDRPEDYFDPAAVYLVSENLPAISYFLGKFLQHQLFAALCKAATFGRRNVLEPLPETVRLSNCDLYGSKAAGNILKDIMSRGNSAPLNQILEETIGESSISSDALLEYYRPLQEILEEFVNRHQIPIDW